MTAIYIGALEHEHGTNFYVAATSAELEKQLVTYAEENAPLEEVELDPDDKVDSYFEGVTHESLVRSTVDVPGLYDELAVEAAMCVWEELNQITTADTNPDWVAYRESQGSSVLRLQSLTIGVWANQIWELISEDARDDYVYDWDFIPACVAAVEWTAGIYTLPDVATTAVAVEAKLREELEPICLKSPTT